MLKNFKDLGIKTDLAQSFTGDKIKIERLLNREITVIDFRIVPSKYPEKGNGMRLDLQIEVDGVQRVMWHGSQVLQDMIMRVPKSEFPFKTTIVRQNERYEFS